MKRASWITVAVLAIIEIAVAAAACGGGGSNINVDDSYSGREVEISVGDTLTLTLPSDIRTGYTWTARVNDNRILHEADHNYIGQVGAGGKDVWSFKASKKGTATVSIEYSRPNEESVPPLETFFLTVSVN